MTTPRLSWTLASIGLACSTADASSEPATSFDTAVVTLAPSEPSSIDSRAVAPGQARSPSTGDLSYPRLRRSYSPDTMRLHACASLHQDGTIVGRACPSGVVVAGPAMVAPTHSDIALRFDIESPALIEIVSDIVSDRARFTHGRLGWQTVAPQEQRAISYGVHVFEATPGLEARIALRGVAPLDFRITNLQIDVQ